MRHRWIRYKYKISLSLCSSSWPPSFRSSSYFPPWATEVFRPCWFLVNFHWSFVCLFFPSVLTRPKAWEYLSCRHTSAPPLSGRGSLPHLSPARGLLRGRRSVSSDLCFCIHGRRPAPVPLSSSWPQVLSRGVGIIGGRALGPQRV